MAGLRPVQDLDRVDSLWWLDACSGRWNCGEREASVWSRGCVTCRSTRYRCSVVLGDTTIVNRWCSVVSTTIFVLPDLYRE